MNEGKILSIEVQNVLGLIEDFSNADKVLASKGKLAAKALIDLGAFSGTFTIRQRRDAVAKEDWNRERTLLNVYLKKLGWVIRADRRGPGAEVVLAQLAKAEPEQQKPEQQKPEQQKPEQQKPEQQKPEQQKPEQQKPEQQKPEQQKPEQQKPEQQKPEQITPDAVLGFIANATAPVLDRLANAIAARRAALRKVAKTPIVVAKAA